MSFKPILPFHLKESYSRENSHPHNQRKFSPTQSKKILTHTSREGSKQTICQLWEQRCLNGKFIDRTQIYRCCQVHKYIRYVLRGILGIQSMQPMSNQRCLNKNVQYTKERNTEDFLRPYFREASLLWPKVKWRSCPQWQQSGHQECNRPGNVTWFMARQTHIWEVSMANTYMRGFHGKHIYERCPSELRYLC